MESDPKMTLQNLKNHVNQIILPRTRNLCAMENVIPISRKFQMRTICKNSLEFICMVLVNK